ncbi:uncharacterized protein LOC111447987 isoform X2 [Cucurbita moschata]|uniref:Uncharacterized protein LOC111447987 isoform X2 n=1 Tax=Cucurbita moschata TaxID=3662 RepID=A0A6J1FWH4_CUCMO|nr:uncharacterized protein LOC111447987 isoform X2 [Cucurbita moschata]
MSGGDDDGPLDYATIQIIPSQNRYEAFACCGNKVDVLADGILDTLLPHLLELQELNAKESKASIKLQSPASSAGSAWFTKSTLTRFLHLVGSPELTKITKTMNEMAQLEETRRFHVSLYGQSGAEFTSSAESKNELLRAMELRLTALNKDFTASFEKGCNATCSSKEISHLVKFMEHFGATNLKNCAYKYLELNPKSDSIDPVDDDDDDDNRHTVTSNSLTQVNYGVSPAKVAQVERQDSSESEESDENGTLVERSRTMARSAPPRRSASPMRRVQIGRTGSRRAPVIMIRSLQTRDSSFSQGDIAANSDEEGSEPTSKTADSNVGRISVQDAISLFESKQRNDASEVEKRRSLTSITIGANKFVLRRWSTGMGDASTKCHSELVSDEPDTISRDFDEHVPKSKVAEEKACTTAEVVELKASDPPETQAGSPISEPREVVEKVSANSEWSRRKEAELDQMMNKVMESKHVAQNNTQVNRKKDACSEQRGELYDQYKAKRYEKRRAEEAKVRTNKEVKTKGMRRVADDRRSKIASAEVNVTKKHATGKPEVLPPANLSKSEKPSMIEKISSRTKPIAATRKSWPSSGITPASVNPTRPTAQPASLFNRSSAKTERSHVQKKNIKETNDSTRNSRRVNEKKETMQTKIGTITKTKVSSRDTNVPVKSSIRHRIAKKSSIVPLESKSFHKGSRNSLDNSSPMANKTKPSKLSKTADSSKNSKKLTHDQEVEVADPDKGDALSPARCDIETVVNDEQDSEMLTSNVVDADHGDAIHLPNEEKSSLEIVAEGESMIPSKSIEEIEEFEEIPIENRPVRLSLSQMLQEDNNELDNNDWGTAENPPMMNYQRGAPKGFKRVLKFARKNKGEANMGGWSSPSVVSEGEDDSEESKSLNTKKMDSLLMKATLNSGLVKASLDKSFDHDKLYSGTYGAQNFSSKFQESHDHATVSSTKGRSFFSLSAFRGSK